MSDSKQFVISDLHLGQASILTFKHCDKPLRNFITLDEMHKHMITEWNKVVRPQDTVYVLGDVVIKKTGWEILKQLKGHKTLIGGNHDIFMAKEYLQYFKNMRGVKVLPYKCVLTHIPIHTESMKDSFGFNIHGHLHGNVVKRKIYKENTWDITTCEYTPIYNEIPDERYINVSVEQPYINYIPREINKLIELRKQGKI